MSEIEQEHEYIEESEEEIREMFLALTSEDIEGQIRFNASKFSDWLVEHPHRKEPVDPVPKFLIEKGLEPQQVANFLIDFNMKVLEKAKDGLDIDGVMKGPIGMTRKGKEVKALTSRVNVEVDADEFFECVESGDYEELAGRVARGMVESLGDIDGLYPYVLVIPTGPFWPRDEPDKKVVGFRSRYSRETG